MKTITILPENADQYRAVSNGKESVGKTAGEALDAISSQMEDIEDSTLVIIKRNNPDKFFTKDQKKRLSELIKLNNTNELSTTEKEELEQLVELELKGATHRAKSLLNELKK